MYFPEHKRHDFVVEQVAGEEAGEAGELLHQLRLEAPVVGRRYHSLALDHGVQDLIQGLKQERLRVEDGCRERSVLCCVCACVRTQVRL